MQQGLVDCRSTSITVSFHHEAHTAANRTRGYLHLPPDYYGKTACIRRLQQKTHQVIMVLVERTQVAIVREIMGPTLRKYLCRTTFFQELEIRSKCIEHHSGSGTSCQLNLSHPKSPRQLNRQVPRDPTNGAAWPGRPRRSGGTPWGRC